MIEWTELLRRLNQGNVNKAQVSLASSFEAVKQARTPAHTFELKDAFACALPLDKGPKDQSELEGFKVCPIWSQENGVSRTVKCWLIPLVADLPKLPAADCVKSTVAPKPLELATFPVLVVKELCDAAFWST